MPDEAVLEAATGAPTSGETASEGTTSVEITSGLDLEDALGEYFRQTHTLLISVWAWHLDGTRTKLVTSIQP